MKKLAAGLVLATGLLAGCQQATTPAPTANTTPPATTTAATPATNAPALAEADTKVKAIREYVDKVEAEYKTKYTRKETALAPNALKGASEEEWAKIHTYTDGSAIKRLKAYPKGADKKTEEFYYQDDKLVYVFVEPQGADKSGPDPAAQGERFYFDNGRLIAWEGAGGKKSDPTSPEFKNYAEKLPKESAAFRAAAK